MADDASHPDDTASGTFTYSTQQQFDSDASMLGRRWWDTPTATVVADLAHVAPFMTALGGVIEILREGHDPQWALGEEGEASARCAFTVVQEGLDAGVEPSEVGDWLRAGCWSAKTAMDLVNVGIRPRRLLDQDGVPVHLVDVGPAEPVPLATAVADSYLTAKEAVDHLVRSVTERHGHQEAAP
jgi:hypothetical protein